MRSAKVLFVYRYCGLGGVETSILTKLQALEKAGVDGSALFSEYCGIGGHTIAAQPRISMGLSASQVYEFLQQDFDLIFVVDYPEFLQVIENTGIETPLLFESHASFPPLLERFYHRMSHPRIAAAVVPSHFNECLVKQVSCTAKEIIVIPNAVDIEIFRNSKQPKETDNLPTVVNGPLVLWIGRLEAQKNPAEFIEIGRALLRMGLKIRFVIIGDVWNYDEYTDQLLRDIEQNERKSFTFLRSVPYEKMPAVYSLAATSGGCLVSSSLFESQPMIFLEAMASECPVVATDVGGVRELVEDRITGRLYKVGDVDHAAQIIAEIVDGGKRADRAQLVASALNRIGETHSLERIGKLYGDVIERFKPWRSPTHTRDDQSFVPGLVSTIIPVYNRPSLLVEAVESVLSQTYPVVEIIIVDDGSTDETASICDRLAAKYAFIKVVHQSHVGLPGSVREVGRLLARGEFIQYLDSDDSLLPRKFEIMSKALRENLDCDIAYCYTRRYVRGEAPRDVPCERTGETLSRMLPEFLGGRFWHTCTPLYRKSICDRAGPWSDLPFLEDMEYDMRLATMNPRLYHCREFLADFRDHDHQRLSKAGFYIDPFSLSQLPRAYGLICKHAQNYGITYEDQNMRSFLTKLGWLSSRCGELGLTKAAEELLMIIRGAGGKEDEGDRRIQRVATTTLSRLSCLSSETLFAIDTLNDRIIIQHPQPIMISVEEKHLVVTGWAVDHNARDLAGGVYVKVDEKPYAAYYGSDRKDVADHFGIPQYRYSGFEAVIPDIEQGQHALSLMILTNDTRGYYLPAQTVQFSS